MAVGRIVPRPIVEGGVGDTVLLGEVALGDGLGMGIGLEGVRDVGARPAKGVWARDIGRVRVRESQGSPWRCFLAESPYGGEPGSFMVGSRRS